MSWRPDDWKQIIEAEGCGIDNPHFMAGVTEGADLMLKAILKWGNEDCLNHIHRFGGGADFGARKKKDCEYCLAELQGEK